MNISATPHNRASELAMAIYAKVLDAVRADQLVKSAMQRVGDALFIQGNHVDLSRFDRIWITGAGKASVSMASAAMEILGDRVSGGLIVTKQGHVSPLPKIDVIEAAHPIPDQSSLDAGDRMLKFAATVSERDLVVFMLSGGASALMEAPDEGITLEDIQEVNQHFQNAGANIGILNDVRSRLSRIKGGGLAEAFAQATVIVLVLSDVVGNDLHVIGSGPFQYPKLEKPMFPGSRQPHYFFHKYTGPFRDFVNDAIALPRGRNPRFSNSIGHVVFRNSIEHYVIGSVSLAVHAAADAAKSLGLTPLPYADPMKGEARVMARKICRHAADRGILNSCMIFGGETTVSIKGNGLGGRSQEMAVAAAEPISKLPDTCFLSAGTDGTDGPTDAAGGIVDPKSIERARMHGFSVRKALADNDSYAYLNACDGLIVTGPTGSNVNDLVLVVHAEDPLTPGPGLGGKETGMMEY